MDIELLKMPIIETKRLVLRPVSDKDAYDMLEYGTNPNVMKFLGWKPYETIDDVYKSLENFFYKRISSNIPESHAIIYKENNKMIGLCDFVDLNERHRCGEIGYVLNEKYWGRGIMVEACQEIIKLGFERFNLIRLQISHDVNNYKSMRVIEKLGFTFEGIKRNGFIKWDGSVSNLKTYSIIEEEYYQKKLPWQI